MSVVHLRKVEPYTVDMILNGKCGKYDTGCSLTAMDGHTFEKIWSEEKCPKFEPVDIRLET